MIMTPTMQGWLFARSDFSYDEREDHYICLGGKQLKRILKLGRLRLRGPTGANEELLLAATA